MAENPRPEFIRTNVLPRSRTGLVDVERGILNRSWHYSPSGRQWAFYTTNNDPLTGGPRTAVVEIEVNEQFHSFEYRNDPRLKPEDYIMATEQKFPAVAVLPGDKTVKPSDLAARLLIQRRPEVRVRSHRRRA